MTHWKPRIQGIVIVFCGLSLLMSAEGCALFRKKNHVAENPPEPPLPKPQSVRIVHSLDPYSLRIRRPSGPGADPKAGPGGVDTVGHPLPNAKLDCEPPSALFASVDLGALLGCLGSAKSGAAAYRLKRSPVPLASLDPQDEEAPACLRSLLPTLLLPREIFFQSTEEGRPLCYSSRLNIEADKTWGFKLPTHRMAIRISFPLSTPPANEAELKMLLLTWVLTPYLDAKDRSWEAHIVPDAICGVCLGAENVIHSMDPPLRLWPGAL